VKGDMESIYTVYLRTPQPHFGTILWLLFIL